MGIHELYRLYYNNLPIGFFDVSSVREKQLLIVTAALLIGAAAIPALWIVVTGASRAVAKPVALGGLSYHASIAIYAAYSAINGVEPVLFVDKTFFDLLPIPQLQALSESELKLFLNYVIGATHGLLALAFISWLIHSPKPSTKLKKQ